MKGSKRALMVGWTLVCRMVVCCAAVGCVWPVKVDVVEAAEVVGRVEALLLVVTLEGRVVAMIVPI